MELNGTKLGNIEIEEARVLNFAEGLIGFPTVQRYVLLERQELPEIAWLQSVDEPGIAFPVVGIAADNNPYPMSMIREMAEHAGLGNDVEILMVVAVTNNAAPSRLVANMLAPLLIDTNTGRAVQVVLDPRTYSASVPLGRLEASNAANANVASSLAATG